MALENRLVLANRFATLFHKVMREHVQVSTLMTDKAEFRRLVDIALASDNEALAAAAGVCADFEGFSKSSPKSSLASIKAPSHPAEAPVSKPVLPPTGKPSLSAEKWKILKEMATSVAGPIGAMVVQRVKASDESADWSSVVAAIEAGLGSVGSRFKALANSR